MDPFEKNPLKLMLSIVVVLLGLCLGSYFFASIVMEGDTAVRLCSGVLTDEKIEAGPHWDIPKFYALRINHGAFQIRIHTLTAPAMPGSHNPASPIIAKWFVADGRQYFKSMQANNPVDDRAAADAQINAELQRRLVLELAKREKDRPLPSTEQDWNLLTKQVGHALFAEYGVRLVSFAPK